MFDTGLMVERATLDPELLAKIKPVTLAGERTLPVPAALSTLFPWGGLQRGTTLAVDGPAGWSLAMALLAEALGDEGWLAIVGVPDFNLVAAADYGIRLDRVLVVQDPGVGRWGTVVATLLESVEVVAVAPTSTVGAKDVRRLTARAREQESILLHLDGGARWPTMADLTLSADVAGWEGLGMGHGHLQARRVTISASGRRGAAASRSVPVLLPGPGGAMAPVPTGLADLAAPAAAPVFA